MWDMSISTFMASAVGEFSLYSRASIFVLEEENDTKPFEDNI